LSTWKTYERQVKEVRATLAAEAFEQAWNEGRASDVSGRCRALALDEQLGRDN
jgi:hypothetical protein